MTNRAARYLFVTVRLSASLRDAKIDANHITERYDNRIDSERMTKRSKQRQTTITDRETKEGWSNDKGKDKKKQTKLSDSLKKKTGGKVKRKS